MTDDIELGEFKNPTHILLNESEYHEYDEGEVLTYYSLEYKAKALKLAAKIGVAKASKELGINKSHLYYWCSLGQKKASVSERESMLATENARLKRLLREQDEELDILKKAAAYFARNQK